MATRLERDVGYSAARCRTRRCNGLDFGMGPSKPLMPSLANNLTRLNDDAPYHRIRLDLTVATLRQFEGTPHGLSI